jgi:peptidyl-prolyl cis-trans isomerase SurA
VLKRRVARTVASGFLVAVAACGLTACRTSPNVAAYVGDEQVTVAELDAAVDQRMDDDGIAAYAKGKEAEYERRVLSLLVQEQVYAVAAERYDVRVTDAQVRSRIDELLGDDDPDTVYGQLAQQGISREDVFENVRQQLLRQEIGQAAGDVEAPTEEELRARYEEVKQDQVKYRFGYMTVPDQATADAVVAQLEATPNGYDAIAAQHPGQYTLTHLTDQTVDALPGPIAQQVVTAQPNSAFAIPVAEVNGFIVTFVVGPVYPSFEDLRPQLEQEGNDAVDAAGTSLVDAVRADLDVVINPRYGVLQDDGQISLDTGEDSVVDILGDDSAAESSAPESSAPAGN